MKFGKISVGYCNFVLPLDKATELVKLLALATEAEDTNWELLRLTPGFNKLTVKKERTQITMDLVAVAPEPYFDAEKLIEEVKAKAEAARADE